MATSTAQERVLKASKLILLLTGSQPLTHRRSFRRPETLPKGTNYTTKEWVTIYNICDIINLHNDCTIQMLWNLEELFNAYKNELMIMKLST